MIKNLNNLLLITLIISSCSTTLKDPRCIKPFINSTALNNFCLSVCSGKSDDNKIHNWGDKCDVSRCMAYFKELFTDGAYQPKVLNCE